MSTLLILFLQSGGSGIGTAAPCLLVIGAIVAILIVNENNKQKALKSARESYQSSLAKLKANPTNADLRQRTLALGRTYSNLTRNKKGATTYDEMALMNDTNAACAATFTSAHKSTESSTASVEQRLEVLSELRSKNLISDEEYTARRKAILDSL
jgi:hypothetical protein